MSVYLDNNATTHLSPTVKKRLIEVIELDPGNPESPHSDGDTARTILESCRMDIANSINAQDDQIIITGSGSESNSFSIGYLQRLLITKGSLKIITSELEHSSLRSGFDVLEEQNSEVVRIPVNSNGVVDLEAIAKEARQGADALIFQWANGITGVIQPIKEIAAIAKHANVYFHIDAAQSYGRLNIDIEEIPCDSMTITAHKIHGPKGIAALYLRNSRIHKATIFGGQQERHLRGGTHNIIGLAGFDAAIRDRFEDLQEKIGYLRGLRDQLETSISTILPDVIIRAEAQQRVPNTSCITFPGIDGLAFMASLDRMGVQCSQSSACRSNQPEPSPSLKAMGLSDEEAYATIRFSVSELNTPEDIEKAVKIITTTFKNSVIKGEQNI